MATHTAVEVKATLESALSGFTTDIGGPPHRVEVLRTHQRTGALIVECDLTGSKGRLPVLVKAADAGEATFERALKTEPNRPRLQEEEHAVTIMAGERATLRAIHGHLRELDDPRFEPVRVLDVSPRQDIIAMERLPHPTLHALIRRYSARPLSSPSTQLLAASTNAGAWLRAFHSMPVLDHTGPHHTTRSDFIATLHEMSTFIADSEGDTRWIERLSTEVTAAAERLLPEDLPCGLSHGDYAPRNILVGPEGRVTGIDTSGRSWSAIYLDLGYFLANTWTLMPSVLTRGVLPPSRILEAVERSFIQGYFLGDPSVRDPVRLYEILTLLARWAAGIQAQRRRRVRSQPARQLLYRARAGYIRSLLKRSLASLERDSPCPTA